MRRFLGWLLLGAMLPLNAALAAQQQAGSIRGVVFDKDFDAPLPAVQVVIVETGESTVTTDQGNYVFGQVPPGRYTLQFSKEGYIRQVKTDVVVAPGQLVDVNASLAGDFTEMEEFVVQDALQLGAGSEAALLQLRLDSPALMDSISADLMSRAGASDAAAALRLVAGASIKDGKSAVIRGLPDRYVSSQMNGVRLPTADEDKRAVELDQYPAAVIESIQVSKTFMPDQQGDASGGAVDVRLRSIPEEPFLEMKGQLGYNSQVRHRDDFLTYDGGGVDTWGTDDGDRDIQFNRLGESWKGAAGVKEADAPRDYKWSISGGGKHELSDGVKIGGFLSFFYERDSEYYDDGVDNSYWVEKPGQPLTPQYDQGTPSQGEFKTALFDVTQGKESVQWGGLGSIGLETENHALNLTYLYTHIAEDVATLATDTRGKQYYFPGYDPNDPNSPGAGRDDLGAAPYLRLETLEYTERTTTTLQLDGSHKLPTGEFGSAGFFEFREPELDWTIARSSAELDQPDKRQFSALWHNAYDHPAGPQDAQWYTYKPSATFSLGNLQRIWKTIEEDSDQYLLNLKLPFENWSKTEGYFKFGVFDDAVDRDFHQESFSNFNDNSSYVGEWAQPWSEVFPDEDHPITESLYDVDYDGDIDVSAYYGMVDLPVFSWASVIGGLRLESTEIKVVNDPEEFAVWFPPDASAPNELLPGAADVDFDQEDTLPAIGLVFEPLQKVMLRTSYSETVARQTFKELTPILQQEYLGGPIFIGNPELEMASLKNYDVRLDYTPYEGGLVSLSYFYKDVEDPIEYVQRIVSFTYTTATNYPKGELKGYEVELRQSLGRFWDVLDGLAAGLNATFIDSEVTLPADEAEALSAPGIEAPMTHRDMTDAPEHLYNVFLTYDLDQTGTRAAVFYTIQGDTLIAGAGEDDGHLVPNVYAKEYETLNLSLSQKLGRYLTLTLQAKNLTNPDIETVYRSSYVRGAPVRSSYSKGVDFSAALSLKITF